MKRILVVWLSVFFLSPCATVVQAQDVVKGFTFATITGKTLDYRSLKGTPMVVNIGSHWWPACKKEAPELQKAYLSYKNRGVLFIGVFVGSADGEIKKFAETYRITFPVGKENGIAEALGVKGIPTTVFIARDGRIVKKYVGTIDSADLVSDIEAMLRWRGWFSVGKDKIEEILAGAGPAAKREILDGLVFRLVNDLNEAEKRDLLHTVLSGRKESRQLSSMVEYWIKECTDSGVNPLEMSKEVVSIVSHSYEMATYSTPELRGIFNDWMGEIENEVMEYLKDRKKMGHKEVADHFRLKPESAIFILSKLAREGKIKMEASGAGDVKRPDNYTGWT